jgi:hypothetical protein
MRRLRVLLLKAVIVKGVELRWRPTEVEALNVERLAEAIWNTISTLPHAEHEWGECYTCDTHRSIVREVVDDDAGKIAAEYARLAFDSTQEQP